MGDPKKKKLDAKRFALTQKHERDYMIRSATRLLKQFEVDREYCNSNYKKGYKKGRPVIALNKKNGNLNEIGTKPIMRCLWVLIGILKNYKRK